MSNNKSVGIVLKVAAFVASAAVGFFVTPMLVSGDKETEVVQLQEQKEVTKPVANTQTQVAAPAQTVAQPEPEQPQPVVEEIVLSYDPVVNNNYIYTFNAHCNLDGKNKLKYELLESASDNVVATNTDGKFTNIQPSANGEYRLRVRVEDDGRLSEVKIVTGFDKKPKEALKKLTATEVETMINQNKTTTRDNVKYFAKNIKIEFTNNEDGRSYPLLADVEAQLIMGIWSSVKVLSVGYNSANQVNSVKIEIVN
ncbi:MAG: hypothetical protein J6U97_03650 [Bacteroidaceae bacterium]|nr:hypothetical protein [Bacteroidaceae bacterium]